MKLGTLELHGLTVAYRTAVARVDFAALPAGLIAIVGENGAGKSTMLEASGPGALYREFPYYGATFAHQVANGVRDASLSLTFTLDSDDYKVLVQADPEFGGGRGKTEAYLLQWDAPAESAPLQWIPRAGPGLREVDLELGKLVMPRELFYASVFAVQGGTGSFFKAQPKDRRDMFAAMLGIGRMQELALEAGKLASTCLKALADIRATREQVEKKLARALELDGQIQVAGDKKKTTGTELEQVRSRLAVAIAHRDDVQRELERLEAELATRVERLEYLTKNEAVARPAVERAELGVQEMERKTLMVPGTPSEGRRAEDINAEAVHIGAWAEALKKTMPEARRLLNDATDHAANEADRASIAGGNLKRAEAAAEKLTDSSAAEVCEVCPFVAEERALAEDVAPRRFHYANAAADAVRAVQQRDALREWMVILDHAGGVIEAARIRIQAEMEEWRQRRAELERIAAAETELARRQTLLEEARGELWQAVAGRLELGDVDRRPLDTQRAELERARKGVSTVENVQAAAEFAHRNAIAGESSLVGERRALGDPASELVTLREQENDAAVNAGDWQLLERALGREGVQALEIAAAGPAVTEIGNMLLHTCYGTRFSIDLETLADKKTGGGTKEVFVPRILDSEAGREAEQGSGGEQVILDEALRQAIAIYNAERSTKKCQTLWRDETVGMLSPANADRYIAMLRKARERGGFHQVLLIAQQPEVWQQADARIFIRPGGVVEIDA